MAALALPFLAALAWSDVKRRYLPWRWLAALALIGLLANGSWTAIGVAGIVLLCGLALAAGLRLAGTSNAVGGGDVKLAAVLSLVVGPAAVVPMLMIGALLTGLAAVTLHRGRTVPMGAYLGLSAGIALVGGLDWLDL